MKEKEVKAQDLFKNVILNDHDPHNKLFGSFNEFPKMIVNILEEEITYEQLGDEQGSTYPDNNVLNKMQSTPAKESDFSSQSESEKESFKPVESDIEKQLEDLGSRMGAEFNTLKMIKTNKAQ